MESIEKILSDIGFYDIPDVLKGQNIEDGVVCQWYKALNLDEALSYYRLNTHVQFMRLFEKCLISFKSSQKLQAAVYVLNEYFFQEKTYNWISFLNRDTEDMFVALVLLSGCRKHITNMQQRRFDEVQIEAHKRRIYECCTIGLDTYGVPMMSVSQLKWGTLFINAHIYEIGRLQFEIKKFDEHNECFKTDGAFCVGIHIPRGGKLDDCLVAEAIKEAKEKLPVFYPELSSQPNFFLGSWLISEDLEKCLPETSNIRLFRDRFQIIKRRDYSSINHFLFNRYDWNIESFPEDTSLRRLVKQRLFEGHKFYDALGILK